MAERDDQGKVVSIRLIPAGHCDMNYELIVEKGRRIEVGPIFGNGSVNSTNNHSAGVESIDEGVRWFRENGGV